MSSNPETPLPLYSITTADVAAIYDQQSWASMAQDSQRGMLLATQSGDACTNTGDILVLHQQHQPQPQPQLLSQSILPQFVGFQSIDQSFDISNLQNTILNLHRGAVVNDIALPAMEPSALSPILSDMPQALNSQHLPLLLPLQQRPSNPGILSPPGNFAVQLHPNNLFGAAGLVSPRSPTFSSPFNQPTVVAGSSSNGSCFPLMVEIHPVRQTPPGYDYEARQHGECHLPTQENGVCVTYISPDAISQMETESEGILTPSLRKKSRSESSSDSEDQSKGGSKGYNGEINRILYGWLSQHATNPYPSADEKRILMRDTGLSKMQLKNWLCNVRRRKLTGAIKRGSSSKRPKG